LPRLRGIVIRFEKLGEVVRGGKKGKLRELRNNGREDLGDPCSEDSVTTDRALWCTSGTPDDM
jgi:hypothetical protein